MRRYWAERITALGCIGVAAYVGIISFEFPAGGGAFPQFAAVSTIFLALLMLVGSFLRAEGDLAGLVTFDLSFEKIKPLLVCLLVIAYVFGIFRLGYYASSILFLVLATWLVGIRNVKAIALTGVILFPLMYAFFELFLRADMPRGVLF